VWDLIQADRSQQLLGFGTAADQAWQLARFDTDAEMAKLTPEHSPEWRSLAVSVLHVLVLGRRLGQNGQPECRYVHLLREAVDAVERKECELAVLVPPATMTHVEKIAGGLEKMPPKSTYFYPKVLSGLVFNPLMGS
jgi:uncharacterized protein (DUF1015 family)